ncbi:MAG: sugar transferase [Calditrichaeota bacterium]|nr:sugar transferase [Calditrichota bacterium]
MQTTPQKNTLIVGWNIEAVSLYDRIIDTPAIGYNVRGFIRPAGNDRRRHYKNVPVLGDLENFSECIKKYNIADVLIVLSPGEKLYLPQIVELCAQNQVDYTIVSDTYESSYDHVIRHVIKDVLTPRDIGFRRVFDVFISLTLLILLFPLFIIVAIAIKLESPGPVLYSQQRLGINGKIFPVYKFRSMVQDAEKRSGPVWASKEDPRITKIGRFLRKTRIDELPQLLNVLKGDMSFIGPRPERPFFAHQFKKKIPFYMARLKTKPGITGLAQVTVGYDETIEDVKEKIKKDIEYIENKNSWRLNLKILLKTVLVVLRGEGQ